MKNIIILTILLFSVLPCKAETNQVFITNEKISFFHSTALLPSSRTNEATKKLESLPAKDFPQGNWGIESNGFQLSCRFEKTSFTNGEPIIAIILVRNVSTNYLSYPLPSLEPASFIVITEQGKTIPEMPRRVSVTGAGIFSGTQDKYYERLDSRYSLTNGTYLVNAYLRLMNSEGKWVRIESGKAKITIK